MNGSISYVNSGYCEPISSLYSSNLPLLPPIVNVRANLNPTKYSAHGPSGIVNLLSSVRNTSANAAEATLGHASEVEIDFIVHIRTGEEYSIFLIGLLSLRGNAHIQSPVAALMRLAVQLYHELVD